MILAILEILLSVILKWIADKLLSKVKNMPIIGKGKQPKKPVEAEQDEVDKTEWEGETGSKVKEKCLTKHCRGEKYRKGVCMKCYSAAKKIVADNKYTWDELEEMGLVGDEENLFTKALKKKLEERGES